MKRNGGERENRKIKKKTRLNRKYKTGGNAKYSEGMHQSKKNGGTG